MNGIIFVKYDNLIFPFLWSHSLLCKIMMTLSLTRREDSFVANCPERMMGVWNENFQIRENPHSVESHIGCPAKWQDVGKFPFNFSSFSSCQFARKISCLLSPQRPLLIQKRSSGKWNGLYARTVCILVVKGGNVVKGPGPFALKGPRIRRHMSMILLRSLFLHSVRMDGNESDKGKGVFFLFMLSTTHGCVGGLTG